MSDQVEDLCQASEHRAWTVLRALAQEHGMTDPSLLPDNMQQLLFMGIKAGTAATIEMIQGHS